MAAYKVVLTVKDSYGNLKEVDSGSINVGLADLTDDELADIEKSLLEKYVTDAELEETLDNLTIDTKTPVYVPEVTPDNILVFTLQDEASEERLEFDIDKSNDWNETDNTTGSSYIWEPMQ